MPDDNSRGGNNTHSNWAERRLGRSYRTETGTEAGYQKSRNGLGPEYRTETGTEAGYQNSPPPLGPEVGQGPGRKLRTKESATFSLGVHLQGFPSGYQRSAEKEAQSNAIEIFTAEFPKFELVVPTQLLAEYP
jgi:hypothetical protein